MHPDEQMIRAYIDGELGPDEKESVAAHLNGCDQCSSSMSEMQARTNRIHQRLEGLDPAELSTPAEAILARVRVASPLVHAVAR